MTGLSTRLILATSLVFCAYLVEAELVHGQGVVVEEVAPGSAGEKAGVLPGDVLLAWERPANPPANPGKAEGTIASPFDWMWVEMEQGPRGPVTVRGERVDRAAMFEVPIGTWGLRVRPRFRGEDLETYMEGQAAVRLRRVEDGMALWSEVAKSAEDVGDLDRASWVYLRIGDTWTEARQWKQAEAAYESARERAERQSNAVASGFIWDLIGRALERQNKGQAAESAFQSGKAIREAVGGESLSVARSLNNLGSEAYNRRDRATAETYYLRALAIYERLAPHSSQVASALNNLGIVSWYRGELIAAEVYHKRALAIEQEVEPDSLGVARSLTNLGIVARDRGDLTLAETLHKRALVIKELRAPDSLNLAITLNNLGNVADNLGDLEMATTYHRRASAIWEKLAPDSLDLASSLSNLGALAIDRGELGAAEAYEKRALAIREKLAPNSLDVARSLGNLGDVAHARGELAAAEAHYQHALTIQSTLAPDSVDMALTLNNLGTVVRDRGDVSTAVAYVERALAIRVRLAPGSSHEAASHHDLGLLYRKANRGRLAAGHLGRAVDALEAQIGKLGGNQETRAGFGAQFADYYRDYIDLLLVQKQTSDAFHVLERSRARTLLAMLGERDLVFTADVARELEVERNRIAWEYDQLQARLARLNSLNDQAQVEGLLTEMRELRARQSNVAERIRQQSPRLASLQYPKPMDVKAVRSTLDAGTLLLSFSVHKDKAYLFEVESRAGITVHTLPIGEAELRDAVEGFRRSIQRVLLGATEPTAALQHGRHLYDVLLRPAEPAIARAQRLLIIPDGPLHALPFAALVRDVEVRAPPDSRDWQYLIESKPVHVVVSATVYAELRRAPENRGADKRTKTLIAFGDPKYPSAAREREGAEPDRQDPVVRSMLSRGYQLTPLPASKFEVSAIVELFRPNSESYLGERATEERAKGVAGETRYLHFASHGLLDERFPLNSGLALTIPDAVAEGQDNGILQAWEIFERVRIDADLVVLSACETGLGKEMGGEGLIGLTRAFQYAGARSVLASLWSVADDTTSELMTRFYRYLKDGRSKDAALRQAQLDFIRGVAAVKEPDGQGTGVDTSHPFYWAAFQINGDWR